MIRDSVSYKEEGHFDEINSKEFRNFNHQVYYEDTIENSQRDTNRDLTEVTKFSPWA